MRATLPFLVVLLPVSIAVAASCSAGSNGTGGFTNSSGTMSTGTGNGMTTGTANTTGGKTGGSTGVGFGGNITVGSGGNTPGGGCSADLQHVVDGNGNVLMTCPPDQGCYGGVCEPACQAAADSKGTLGCDFYAPDPPFYSNGTPSSYAGSCYAAFVANAWSRPAQITISRGGQTFNVTQFGYIPSGVVPNVNYQPVPATGVPPGQVAVLFLSNNPNAVSDFGTTLTCPKTPALLQDGAVQGSGAGSAFHVVSDTPLSAYDILPYGGALSYLPSASLLFPSTAWGTNYYVVSPHIDGGGELWMLLVGSKDGTMVTAAPINTLTSGGNPPELGGGQSTTFAINQGQILQWVGSDPSGTVLQSTDPIGVFTGSTYLRVATQTSPGGGGEDSAHQQIPQIKALGNEYVGPGISSRLANGGPESIPYRLIGVVDGTTLTYDPGAPPNAPASLNAGQIAEFETTNLFVVRSQDTDHPFGVTHYMPGTPLGNSTQTGCSNQPMFQGGCSLGDEDWVNLLPPAQFLQRYVFFTDPTYATTNLVVTRVKGSSGFADVTIDCMNGPIGGWMNVDNAGTYQVAHVDLIRGSVPVASCNGSSHQATSTGKFGINVWGTDWFSSYGYPAGGNVGSINMVVVPPNPK